MIKCCHKCWNIYYVASENPWHPSRCGCQESPYQTRYDSIYGTATIPTRELYARVQMTWDEEVSNRLQVQMNRREQLRREQELLRAEARAQARSYRSISRTEYNDWLTSVAASFNNND